MNITELIVELLQQGQKVELPEIGTFDSVVQSPHHDPVTRIYYPSTRSIVFSEGTTGDNAIVKEIARRDCVSEDVAQQMWRNYIDALTDKIKRTGEHRLGELGTLTKVGDKYGFDMAEGIVIEAGNSNETPLEEVRTYDHSDSEDPFAQFEAEPEVTEVTRPEPAPKSAPEPTPVPEAQIEPASVPNQLTESTGDAGEAMTVGEEWKESLKKLEELPKSKAQLKAEAKEEKERQKAEAKAEKERERLRKRAEKDAEVQERVAAHQREIQERKDAEERRRAEEEMRKAEERAEQSRRKAEKEAQASMKRAQEMADEESRKAAKKAAVLAAVAASQAGSGSTVAAESVATSATEVVKAEKEARAIQKENEKQLREADKLAAKEAARKRKEEKELEKAAARLAKEERKSERRKGGSKWVLWLVILLVLLAFAAIVYVLFFRGQHKSAPAEDVATSVGSNHLNVPVVNALTFNPDMIPYTDREIGRNRDLVCSNMAEYINNYLAERDFRSARVPMFDRVRQYADERMQQLLGDRFAVQRFIPYDDYVYEKAEPWLKQTYADVARHMVQGELMNRQALDDILNGIVEELGIQPGEQQRTAAEVQQVKASEQATVARRTKALPDKDAPVYVYVEKNSKQGFDIIAGFYLNKNTAAKMTARLHELGCDAYIIEKNDMFYVSMGSAPTRTKAEALYNHIKSWYDGDIVIKEL